jgi:DNA-directed RNA polymerase subunit alpha
MNANKHFPEINIEFKESTDTFAKLVAQPFERGYAVTVGNSLRRTLLTSVPGAAITSIKVDGVNHEFSTIDGVTEDVSDLILNLKQVRFKLDDVGPENINIKLKGPGKFTGKDINKASEMFEVLNHDIHLATLTEKADFNIEIQVSRGKGYTASDKNKRTDAPLGTIFIDSIYNPITNVAFDVVTLPTSTEGHEMLSLEVKSDGSTTPRDAINHAASLLRQQLALFMFTDSSSIKAVDEEEINEAIEKTKLLSKSIDEMELYPSQN